MNTTNGYTHATHPALAILRDGSHLQWYVVTLLALVLYVYALEVERRRWDIVAAGLAFLLMDVFNELVNSAWLHASGTAALWTVTGPTSYLILVGWCIEIAFMFAIGGILFVKALPPRQMRIAGLPNRWVLITSWSCFAVFVEVLLTRAGIFHWHWAYWGWPMLLPIVVFGYGTFFFAAAFVFDLDSHRKRFAAVGAIAAVDACLATVLGVAGWL